MHLRFNFVRRRMYTEHAKCAELSRLWSIDAKISERALLHLERDDASS